MSSVNFLGLAIWLAVVAAVCAVVIYFLVLVIKALKKYLNTSSEREEKKRVCRSLGEAIRENRIRCKMIQEFVAESLGVSRQAVSKWENATLMTIKEIEELSGIARANIRFYEKEGLITPQRQSNGYREYSQDDLDCLKRIRLLRIIHFSLEDIKALIKNERDLTELLLKHIRELQKEKQTLAQSMESVSNSAEAEYLFAVLIRSFILTS